MELLRLRSEVRQLREQTGQVANLRRAQLDLHKRLREIEEENFRLQDATNMTPRLPRIGAWLGIAVANVDQSNAPPDFTYGVMVSEIAPGGPASKSLLKAGDFITAIEGTPVTNTDGLKAILATKRGGDSVHLIVQRTNEYHAIVVQSRDWPQ